MSEYCHNCGKTISEDTEKLCGECKGDQSRGIEFTGNQRLTDLRWNGSALEMQITEDYQRHESDMMICSGSRKIWKPVGFETVVIGIVERAGEDEMMMGGTA